MSLMNFNQMMPKAKTESVLDSMENQIKLTNIFKEVYNNRPNKLTEFVGAMSDNPKKAEQYSLDQIKHDEQYVEEKSGDIDETNSSYGLQEKNYRENKFAHAEIGQAMLTHLINKVWFPEFKAIMTHEFDDLRNGIDTVLKKDETFLGLGIDFTISGQEEVIANKLTKEWTNHVSQGRIANVKYFKDPDTGYMGNKMTPKFIVGCSEAFVMDGAAAYLSGNQDSLKNHPMRESFIRQIEMQLDYALDYFEEKLADKTISPIEFKKFNFTNNQYKKVKLAVAKFREDTSVKIDPLEAHIYSKESVAEKAIKNFYNPVNENK